MGTVASRLEKLAAAGLPVAPLTLCETDDAVREAAAALTVDISLRYEGARLRSSTSIEEIETALSKQRQALERARMVGLVDEEPRFWVIQETPAATLVEIDSRDASTGEATGGDLAAQAEATLGQPLKLTLPMVKSSMLRPWCFPRVRSSPLWWIWLKPNI